jgi:hypothetical protein
MKRRSLKTIPFGEWLPDIPDFGNPGLREATNVIPDQFSYQPHKAFSAISTVGLDARCRGFSGAVGAGHQTYAYAGDASKLYSLVGTTWNDVSKSGGYTLGDDSDWEFAQFGETFVATSYDDPVQSITPGGANFADMITSTNKPKARHVGVVGQFLVLGHTNDTTDGVKRSRVWWSAIRDQTDFDPDADTQCDYEDLKEGGDVQRIIGGVEYGLVFCERAIYRMTYVGPPLVFRFDPIDRKRGTPLPGSVTSLGRLTYYISDEGFYITDGAQSHAIGENKVDEEFWLNQFDISLRTRVTSGIDPLNKTIVWSFPGSGNTNGTPNKLFIYHWPESRWSSADVEVECIGSGLSLGTTLEEVGALYPDLETVPFSLDAISWTGGDRLLAAFNTSQQYGTFTGANLAATITTGSHELAKGFRARVQRVRPMVDGGAITTSVAGREDLQETQSFDTAADINDIGDTAQNNSGRYHDFRVSIAAGGSWNHAQGIDVEYVHQGRR